jgi:ubiquinone/menaquinone biosynthesis C-methylase UbiE
MVRRISGCTVTRWDKAQQYEQSYWRDVAETIVAGTADELTWYRINAEKYRDLILPHLRKAADKIDKVVEIGSGPVGVATFFELGTCYATDPLEEFYRANPTLSALRNRSVTYLKSAGETLPFADRDADVVIVENVLDHTRRPDVVLDEIRRILADDGVMFFKVNVRTPIGTWIHRVLSRLNIDKGHPHSYSENSIRATLMRHGFAIRYEHVDHYDAAREADRESDRLKDRLKSVLGLSQFWFTAVCWKAS